MAYQAIGNASRDEKAISFMLLKVGIIPGYLFDGKNNGYGIRNPGLVYLAFETVGKMR